MSEANENQTAQMNANLAALLNANENSALQPGTYTPPFVQAWYSVSIPL